MSQQNINEAHCEECEDLSCSISDKRDLGGLRETIFRSRYANSNEETWEEAAQRVANAVSSIEAPNIQKVYISRFKKMIEDFTFIPGGRIIRNAGKVQGNLLNCFVLGVEDNIYSIAYDLYAEAMVVSKYGGGIGFNLSALRPRGEELRSQGMGSMASGAVSFLIGLDFILNLIKGGGGRRGAGLSLLGVWHPEIMAYISVKLDDGVLSNFNLSVGITDEFIKAVKKDKPWQLVFNNKVYSTVPARDLWNFLVEHSWKSAEPGLLNIDKIQRENNLYYHETIAATNPCGEVPLPVHGACCLGSVNLSNCYDDRNNTVDWKKLKETVGLAVRFLDNVLEVNFYPVESIGLNVKSTRRIGIGTMGLHHLMLKCGIREYGSPEALEFIDELYRKLRDYGYLASIELARERGPFEKFIADKYLAGEFVKRLPRRIRKNIKEFGIRNATVISIAPTGTTSLVAGTSQGIEPIFSPIYKRKYYSQGGVEEVVEWDSLFREFVVAGKDVSHFIGAYDVSPEHHLEVQSTIQQYVDNAISKTINISRDYDKNELGVLLLDYIEDLKGTTVYREGCKGEEVLTPMPYNFPLEELQRMANE
jgi:ribonucleoside-diphosphate reductase alpha chain